MKPIINFLLILSCCFIYGQKNDNNSLNQNFAKFFAGGGVGSTYFYNPKREIEGSEYLFSDWWNHAIIYTKTNQKFSIRNINYSIQKRSFASQIAKDSLFVFDMDGIDKIVVNDKTYKEISAEGGDRIFEVIFENTDFSVLKGYKIRIISGSVNPMINRKTDKLAKRKYYYVLKKRKLTSFRLKKSYVFSLFSENEKVELKNYVKKNRLSFKKEKDIKRILEHFKGA